VVGELRPGIDEFDVELTDYYRVAGELGLGCDECNVETTTGVTGELGRFDVELWGAVNGRTGKNLRKVELTRNNDDRVARELDSSLDEFDVELAATGRNLAGCQGVAAEFTCP